MEKNKSKMRMTLVIKFCHFIFQIRFFYFTFIYSASKRELNFINLFSFAYINPFINGFNQNILAKNKRSS